MWHSILPISDFITAEFKGVYNVMKNELISNEYKPVWGITSSLRCEVKTAIKCNIVKKKLEFFHCVILMMKKTNYFYCNSIEKSSKYF